MYSTCSNVLIIILPSDLRPVKIIYLHSTLTPLIFPLNTQLLLRRLKTKEKTRKKFNNNTTLVIEYSYKLLTEITLQLVQILSLIIIIIIITIFMSVWTCLL